MKSPETEYNFLTKEQSDALTKILIKFYTETALDIYEQQHEIYLQEKQKHEEALKKIDRGTHEEFNEKKEYFSKLVWHMETLSDLLDQDLPDYRTSLDKIKGQAEEIKLTEEEKEYWPYDDIEEMKFYQKLPAFEDASKDNIEQEETEGEGEYYDPFNSF